MAIVFDPKKSAKNLAERGISFELASEIDWNTARLIVDDRKEYGETRVQVWAAIEGRLYCIVVTPRGEDLRVISLRKANRKEVKRYDEEDH
ncbi:BrnT family toxin [Acidisoma cellulosilytica]|uniref:BrnT family toxin n=1 Tax=Acidisoma cellulosilyticum TaxID=2802395 RepID=A0A964E214_9PROT|nr:BrnT family toxin [Acidisoma cellulosilyticum]MCB8879120.1 BrnT family toxin [Acidisoma cellulosilyticum]